MLFCGGTALEEGRGGKKGAIKWGRECGKKKPYSFLITGCGR